MIEIVSVEQKQPTDQGAIEAADTIRRYCNGTYCDECAIGRVCDICFRKIPSHWPEVEVPDD